jgi:hypothetical protein
MLARGRKLHSVELAVRSLMHLDQATNGTLYAKLSPETLTSCLPPLPQETLGFAAGPAEFGA